MTINKSTIEANTASGGGGGIVIDKGLNVVVKNSTIDKNSAASYGGGILFPDSAAEDTTYNIRNSTIFGNTADRGGGIFVEAKIGLNNSTGTTALKVYNSTIAGNTATNTASVYDGGGIGFVDFVSGDKVYLESTIVATNTTTNTSSDRGPDIGGHFASSVSAIHSMIGIADDGGWTFSANTSNQNGTLAVPRDPHFVTVGGVVALANYGGSTKTLALASNSDAIDNGDNTLGLTYDQRDTGYPRVNGIRADIGAYETTAIDNGN